MWSIMPLTFSLSHSLPLLSPMRMAPLWPHPTSDRKVAKRAMRSSMRKQLGHACRCLLLPNSAGWVATAQRKTHQAIPWLAMPQRLTESAASPGTTTSCASTNKASEPEACPGSHTVGEHRRCVDAHLQQRKMANCRSRQATLGASSHRHRTTSQTMDHQSQQALTSSSDGPPHGTRLQARSGRRKRICPRTCLARRRRRSWDRQHNQRTHRGASSS